MKVTPGFLRGLWLVLVSRQSFVDHHVVELVRPETGIDFLHQSFRYEEHVFFVGTTDDDTRTIVLEVGGDEDTKFLARIQNIERWPRFEHLARQV